MFALRLGYASLNTQLPSPARTVRLANATPARLREPDGRTVARVDPEQLGVLLPFLVEHHHP